MEIFFVYGLVLIFFLLTLLFVIVVLPAYVESPASYKGSRNTSAGEQITLKDKRAVYGTLMAIFIGLLVVTVLNEKESH